MLAKSREEKGGRTDGGEDDKNALVTQSFRGRQGTEEQVEGGKTAIEGRAVEAGRMEVSFARQSNTGKREENRV